MPLDTENWSWTWPKAWRSRTWRDRTFGDRIRNADGEGFEGIGAILLGLLFLFFLFWWMMGMWNKNKSSWSCSYQPQGYILGAPGSYPLTAVVTSDPSVGANASFPEILASFQNSRNLTPEASRVISPENIENWKMVSSGVGMGMGSQRRFLFPKTDQSNASWQICYTDGLWSLVDPHEYDDHGGRSYGGTYYHRYSNDGRDYHRDYYRDYDYDRHYSYYPRGASYWHGDWERYGRYW